MEFVKPHQTPSMKSSIQALDGHRLYSKKMQSQRSIIATGNLLLIADCSMEGH